MNNSSAIISIIMNCFNGEKYIKEALQSILSQTYENWELIFWDNQSKDGSKKVLESFKDKRLKYFYAPDHTKLFKARNLALKKISGDFLCFLDTDDYWSPTKLEDQLKYFQLDNRLVFSFTKYQVVNANGEYLNVQNQKNYDPKNTIDLIKDYQVGLSTVMLNLYKLRNYDLKFDDNLNIIGDFDLFIKLSKEFKFKFINKQLSFYRWHDNNLSTVNNDQEIDELYSWYKFHKVKNFFSKNELKTIDQKIVYSAILNLIRNKKYFFSIKKIIKFPLGKKKLQLIYFFIKQFLKK